MYKFLTHHNSYDEYQFVETKTFQQIELNKIIEPLNFKLFSNDIFNYENDTINIVHSAVRYNEYIPGILDLSISHNKEKDKFLYLCKPDDKRIPYFLISYKIPYNFDKSIKKLYITFKYKHWDNKYPHGTITQNFGNISVLNNFYEYILYCKSLNVSIQKFTKEAKNKLKNSSNEEIIQSITDKYYIKTITKNDEFIFTLDSKISNDHDDAMSYNFTENKISIYITNVALIMDYLNLWSSFTNRISTIYLPDKKRSMLPTILIEGLCSLKEKQNKLCYVLNIYYDDNNNIINESISICNAYISKNYSHEYNCTYSINKYYKKIKSILKVGNSKDVVTKLMLHFNHYMANFLSETRQGIYRSSYNKGVDITDIPNYLPTDIYNHICMIKTHASNYSIYDSIVDKKILYLQITSPIRRLVDVLNNIALLDYLKIYNISDSAKEFYNHWTQKEQIEYINISSRTIRKIQSKCKIYNQYEINKNLNKEVKYTGYVFDKLIKSDGKYQYMVYLPELQLTTYVTILYELNNYGIYTFSLYVFMNEESEKKKIKLQLDYIK